MMNLLWSSGSDLPHLGDPRGAGADAGCHEAHRGRRQGLLPPLHRLQHPGPGGQLGEGQGLSAYRYSSYIFFFDKVINAL